MSKIDVEYQNGILVLFPEDSSECIELTEKEANSFLFQFLDEWYKMISEEY